MTHVYLPTVKRFKRSDFEGVACLFVPVNRSKYYFQFLSATNI